MELLKTSKSNINLNLLRRRDSKPILFYKLLQNFNRLFLVYKHTVWLRIEDAKK